MNTLTDEKTEERLTQFLTENLAELRDAIGLNDGEVEALYAQAYDYYQTGQYEESVNAFATLTQLSHLEKRFHTGYGASLQCMGLYTDAIRAYMTASTLDLSDPEPTLNIGYCLMQLKLYEDAKNTLNLVIDETTFDEEKQAIRQQAQAWIGEIERLEFI